MGLWGRPAESSGYEEFYVEGVEGMTCWVQQDVLDRIPEHPPTEEGDHLFYVEGIGRMRWSILKEDERPWASLLRRTGSFVSAGEWRKEQSSRRFERERVPYRISGRWPVPAREVIVPGSTLKDVVALRRFWPFWKENRRRGLAMIAGEGPVFRPLVGQGNPQRVLGGQEKERLARMDSVRLTSNFWIDEIGKHEHKCFHIDWRTIILGCCSCYKGAGAFLGQPEDPAGYTRFQIEGTDGLECWLHRDLLAQWRKNGPMPEGDYLFVVQTVGRFRLAFPGGFPERLAGVETGCHPGV